MQRQDVHILKSMMRGNICSPYSSTALKALVERAIKLPLIYMGDRELNTDEVLNFKPSEGDPPALMQEGSYDEFILMLTMANYTHPDVEHMSPEMREQYRSEEGDVDIWCYIIIYGKVHNILGVILKYNNNVIIYELVNVYCSII